MLSGTDEVERPLEWLLGLRESATGYLALLRNSGGLAPAAYRIARAKCLASDQSSSVPSAREIRAALSELGSQLGLEPVPSARTLIRECELSGLALIP